MANDSILSVKPHLCEDYQRLGNKFVEVMEDFEKRRINLGMLVSELKALLVDYENTIDPNELQRTRPGTQSS